MATREYKHPLNGKVGEFTDLVAKRYGFVPVDESVEHPVAAAEPEGDLPEADSEKEGE